MGVQYGNVTARICWIVGFVRPSIEPFSCRMADQLEDFYNTFPNCFPLKHLLHWDAFKMHRLHAMQLPNHAT